MPFLFASSYFLSKCGSPFWNISVDDVNFFSFFFFVVVVFYLPFVQVPAIEELKQQKMSFHRLGDEWGGGDFSNFINKIQRIH